MLIREEVHRRVTDLQYTSIVSQTLDFSAETRREYTSTLNWVCIVSAQQSISAFGKVDIVKNSEDVEDVLGTTSRSR